jgi:hypothetical protein
MNIASIIGNTAVQSFSSRWFYSWCSFAGIVAALGALQLIAAIAQPLPDRGGFYDGGYTGSGPERNSPGAL